MKACDVLFTVASWEDRFLLGFERILNEWQPKSVLMYYLDQYADRSREKRASALATCQKRGIAIEEVHLGWSEPAENWKSLRLRIASLTGGVAVVDITTMPREIIWYSTWLLQWRGIEVRYVYHSPESYNQDWLSRDPGRPRLVVKMSGESRFGQKTVLVVVAGYDPERTNQLIQFFEPEQTLLGIQDNEGDAQNVARMKRHVEQCRTNRGLEVFALNAFGEDRGETAIAAQVDKVRATHNVIMSSLGPKLSAVALYRIQQRHQEIGLAYAPSREYNQDYSKGIGRSFTGLM